MPELMARVTRLENELREANEQIQQLKDERAADDRDDAMTANPPWTKPDPAKG